VLLLKNKFLQKKGLNTGYQLYIKENITAWLGQINHTAKVLKQSNRKVFHRYLINTKSKLIEGSIAKRI
jgi:hypothetical protein